MPITATCTCGKSVRVKDELAGKRARCPGCGQVLTIPAIPDPVMAPRPEAITSQPTAPVSTPASTIDSPPADTARPPSRWSWRGITAVLALVIGLGLGVTAGLKLLWPDQFGPLVLFSPRPVDFPPEPTQPQRPPVRPIVLDPVDPLPKEKLSKPKRHNPAVLAPVELQADLLRTAVKQHMHSLVGNQTKVAILVDGGGQRKLEYMDLNKLPAGAKLAETIKPQRMIVVSAAFPYRQQLDLCRAAMQLSSLAELASDLNRPRFLPLQVRRRTLDGSAKVLEDWSELNPAPYRELMVAAVSNPEADDLKKVTFPAFAMDRPALARGAYPPLRLSTLNRAAQALADESRVKPACAVLAPALAKDDRQPDALPKSSAPGPILVPEQCLVRVLDVTVQPGLIYQYQVRVRLANPNFGKPDLVVDPAMAAVAELAGAWAPERPVSVPVSGETFVYGVELDNREFMERAKADPRLLGDKDATFVQVHRWLETAAVDPANANTSVPVGDWVTATMPVRRGEFIGRKEPVEVATWYPTLERFALAVPIPPAPANPLLKPVAPPRGLAIDFSTDDLLVDWHGGRIVHALRLDEKSIVDVREDANAELLILSADGKLRVRHSRADMREPSRVQRESERQSWLEVVRNQKP
ncbi:MAG: hypothetical protein JNM56_25135 [Planctomycetia bacterium]|nr:hypothetical protein [Planctomycetia bacterium]